MFGIVNLFRMIKSFFLYCVTFDDKCVDIFEMPKFDTMLFLDIA